MTFPPGGAYDFHAHPAWAFIPAWVGAIAGRTATQKSFTEASEEERTMYTTGAIIAIAIAALIVLSALLETMRHG